MRYRGWIPWLLLLGQLGFAYGQSALDGFDPQATSTVDTIALQQDGKILLGGSFTSILGAVRNGIARLNSDGTLDETVQSKCPCAKFYQPSSHSRQMERFWFLVISVIPVLLGARFAETWHDLILPPEQRIRLIQVSINHPLP